MLRNFNINSLQIITKNHQTHASVYDESNSLHHSWMSSRTYLIDSLLANVDQVESGIALGAWYAIWIHSLWKGYDYESTLSCRFSRSSTTQTIDVNNEIENSKRTCYYYQVGEWVLIRKDTFKILSKLEERFIWPYTIVQTHVSRTVTIRKRRNVLER